MTGRGMTAAGIAAAAGVIDPAFLDTPLIDGVRIGGLPLLVKDETANPIRSFKGRGTEFFAHVHAAAMPVVVCASAGNFGQGLARAMARRGGRAVVFAATGANPLKIDRMRALGAEVVLQGEDFDAANAAARAHAEARGLAFVEDAAWPEIAEGAGTIAREMTAAGTDFDAVYVPAGGGALVSGIGCWLRDARPGVRVIGVCAEGAPSLALSWRAGRVVPTDRADTIADGIAVRAPAAAAVAVMRQVVDDMVLVSDAQIVAAMRLLHAATGIAAEPAGAAGVAAALADAPARGVRRAATVVCGANVAPQDAARWFGQEVGA